MNNFDGILEEMKLRNMIVPNDKVIISIPNAKEILMNAFKYFLSLEKKEVVWIERYNDISKWLENNEGKGLLLYGTCGQGKSLLCRYIIPAIFLKYQSKIVKVFDTQEMNKRLDEALEKKIISLDDIGTEDVLNSYGNKRMAFAELLDNSEKKGNLLIISSNLTAEELKKMYGDRIYDRLISTTKRVLFTGKSMRI